MQTLIENSLEIINENDVEIAENNSISARKDQLQWPLYITPC